MLGITDSGWRFCPALLCVAAVTACGGGGGGGGSGEAAPVAAAANSSTVSQKTFRVIGSVGDGPITRADLVFTDKNGRVIATASSDDQATYSVDLPQDSASPIKVSATGGTDMVTGRPVDFELLSLISTAEDGTANISPTTTVLAQSFDCGFDTSTEFSGDEIWAAARDELTLGLEQTQFADPVTQSVGPQSAAAFVLINEALGEVFRRSALVISEQQEISEFEAANELIRALGCDLVDGAFDGMSGEGTLTDSDKLLLGVVRVMDTLVRLELLTGKLSVDGTDATLKLNAAIDAIQPTSVAGVNDVLLANNALEVVLESLSVLASLDDSGELGQLEAALQGVAPDIAIARTSQALDSGLGEQISAIGPKILTLSIAQVDQVVSLQPIVADNVAVNSDTVIDQTVATADQSAPAPDESAVAAQQASSTADSDVQAPAEASTPVADIAETVATADQSAPAPDESAVAAQQAPSTADSDVQAPAEASTPVADIAETVATVDQSAPAPDESAVAAQQASSTEDSEVQASAEASTPVANSVDTVATLDPSTPAPDESAVAAQQAPSTADDPVPPEAGASEPVANPVETTAAETPAETATAEATEPTVQFLANSTTVTAGSYVELEWTSTDVTSCSADGAWTGSKAAAGSELIGPVNKASTYTLSCDGSGGTAVAMIQISAQGSVNLAWQAPKKNTDGTLVKGLSRYKVYYGTESRQYNDPIQVSGDKSKHTLELPVGSYYFAISAIDLEGDESALSNEIVDLAK